MNVIDSHPQRFVRGDRRRPSLPLPAARGLRGRRPQKRGYHALFHSVERQVTTIWPSAPWFVSCRDNWLLRCVSCFSARACTPSNPSGSSGVKPPQKFAARHALGGPKRRRLFVSAPQCKPALPLPPSSSVLVRSLRSRPRPASSRRFGLPPAVLRPAPTSAACGRAWGNPRATWRFGGRRTRPPKDVSRWLTLSVGGRSRR